MNFNEKWIVLNGGIEIASDVEFENIISQKAHKALGFTESLLFVYPVRQINPFLVFT